MTAIGTTARATLPDVSVVMATHRLQDLASVHAAVASLRAQTVPIHQIVVAVDHNPELAHALRSGLAGVVLIANDGPQRGASATRNAGAAVCTTPVIAFLDDDEVADPDWLANLLPPLADPLVVGTGGRYVPLWDRQRPGWFPDELAWAVGAHHSGMPDVSAPVRNVWSGNMAVRSTTFRAVGGFREGFGKSGTQLSPEDTDLCIRMAAAVPGGHWIYRPDARIGHTVPAERSTFRFYVRRCFAEGRGKIMLRDLTPDPDVLDTERDYLRRTIPAGLAGHLAEAGRSLARAGAIIVGVGAAGVGAGVSSVASRRR